MVPLSSTSELRMFLGSLFVVLMVGSLQFGSDRRLRRFWRGGEAGRRGWEGFVRVDVAFAHESGPFLNDQFGSANVAEQFRLGLDLDFFLCGGVAGDFAPHDDGIYINVAADDGFLAEVERALRLDFTVELSGESQFAGEFEIAFDFDICAEGITGAGIGHGVHSS